MMFAYYWRDNEVVHSPLVGDFYDCYCYDPNALGEYYRYGMFPRDMSVIWKHIPFEEFPREFKMALLLLGIS